MSDVLGSYFLRTRKGLSVEVAARVTLGMQVLTCACQAVKPVFPLSGGGLSPVIVARDLEAPGTYIVLMTHAGSYDHQDGIASGASAMWNP